MNRIRYDGNNVWSIFNFIHKGLPKGFNSYMRLDISGIRLRTREGEKCIVEGDTIERLGNGEIRIVR